MSDRGPEAPWAHARREEKRAASKALLIWDELDATAYVARLRELFPTPTGPVAQGPLSTSPNTKAPRGRPTR